MRSVVEIGASVPAFLGKLWKLVNDTETNHLISWSPGGKTFVIKNQADFARELLPLYYKHNNMASFIRQLNMYGFHKITSVENGGLRYEKDEIEFTHPCFMKGHAYLLEHIKRKIANPKSIVSSNESGEKILLKPELMNKMLADVKHMKGKQESLDAKFSAMKQENEALWREVAILRQKHIKQQQIVNNLIQFLMSLVQPTRPPNTNGNNVGVKRPYQLMINSEAHYSGSDNSYPSRLKNIKLDKDALLEDFNEENLEDGPTIHELAHDDILHNDSSQDSMIVGDFVNITLPEGVTTVTGEPAPNPSPKIQYQVTLEDGDEIDTDGLQKTNDESTGIKNVSFQNLIDQAISTAIPVSPGPSKPKGRVNKTTTTNNKSLLTSNNFNTLNPSADLKLPAEIFASDDSVSDAGVGVADELPTTLYDMPSEPCHTSRDKMLGGINIKLEKPLESKGSKKAKKTNKDTGAINLADIKTELQDEFDWNNMSLATVNNNTNVNRFQSRNRRDNIVKSREDYYGTNSNKDDIDDHLDTMQTDIDSLRELLRSDTYAFDTNTLLGLFGSDDPFYGLSYNNMDGEKSKASNSAKKQKGDMSRSVSGDDIRVQDLCTEDDVEGNQLMSYTGNIPDFEDISMSGSGESPAACPSPPLSVLNTPQLPARSPLFVLKP